VVRVRHSYGPRRGQVADLYRPSASEQPTPVVVLIHGGFWRPQYTRHLMRPLATAVVAEGWLAWNIEYRRPGPFGGGGGWPETFADVAEAIDHLATLPGVDATRVVACGHSAGGHLALWAAARGRLAAASRSKPSGSGVTGSAGFGSAGSGSDPAESQVPGSQVPGSEVPGSEVPGSEVIVGARGAVALAGIPDLVEADRLGVGGDAVRRLLGGGPGDHPDRYRLGSPQALLPLGVPQVLVHGTADTTVPPEMGARYVERAAAAGDDAVWVPVAGAGHRELIDPRRSAWPLAVGHLRRLLTAPAAGGRPGG